MTEYTPSVEEARERYQTPQSVGESLSEDAAYYFAAEFDRMIAKVKADAAAEATAEVRAAWTVQGRAPLPHRMMQQCLRRDWPVLADTLDTIARRHR